MISSQVKEDTCEICQSTVSELMDKLKDPDTQVRTSIFGFLALKILVVFTTEISLHQVQLEMTVNKKNVITF